MQAVLIILSLCSLAGAKKGGKSVVDPNVVNPDGDVLVPKDSAEYNKGMVEGDIVPAGGNSEDRNAVSDKRMLWPRAEVPFVLDRSVGNAMKRVINKAIADFNQYTCVRWIPKVGHQDYYVNIQTSDTGCYAYMGRQYYQPQILNLQPHGCQYKGTVIHEMLHTIGFSHEQKRSDRDQYITVHWDRIMKNKHDQFTKNNARDEDRQGFPYDYSSVMHYNTAGFGNGNGPTMTTKDRSKQSLMGQRSGFSKIDIAEVNKLYGCKGQIGGGSSAGSGGSTSGSKGGSGGGKGTGGSSGGSSGGCRDAISSCGTTITSFTKSKLCTKSRRDGYYLKNCNRSCGQC